MTRKTCINCNERKDIVDFQKDKRNKSGYENRCKDCKNASARSKIECPKCKQFYTRATLYAHMKTAKCANAGANWKHPMPPNNRFKSRGKELVQCPCKHKACKGEIQEHIAYRHMRYGIDHKFPSQMKSKRADHSDSDSERDL